MKIIVLINGHIVLEDDIFLFMIKFFMQMPFKFCEINKLRVFVDDKEVFKPAACEDDS
jgi:hypothetical protein